MVFVVLGLYFPPTPSVEMWVQQAWNLRRAEAGSWVLGAVISLSLGEYQDLRENFLFPISQGINLAFRCLLLILFGICRVQHFTSS